MAKTPNRIMVPANLPNWRRGTSPMNIIKNTTAKSMAEVDRFSKPIRKQAGRVIHIIHLNALRSAPLSRCMAANICATMSTTVPLAISEGWKVKPNRLIQRPASPTLVPAKSTHSRVISDTSMRNGVMSLK